MFQRLWKQLEHVAMWIPPQPIAMWILLIRTGPIILRILGRKPTKWWYGWQILEASEGLLNGDSIYTYLDLLIEDGLVNLMQEEDAERELLELDLQYKYKITDLGLNRIQPRHLLALSSTPESV